MNNNFILDTTVQHNFMWHLFKRDQDTRSAVLTGWDPEGLMQVGTRFIDKTVVMFGKHPEYRVIEVVERRDHKGRLNDPANKKNSFFRVSMEWIEESYKEIQQAKAAWEKREKEKKAKAEHNSWAR